ncbi:MAG: NapC/NirT family cytochrome c [Alphaproteobacteria bacterium]|nr:NapC/NirT family cytochrome c [Alphaproteobacteria bacterium]
MSHETKPSEAGSGLWRSLWRPSKTHALGLLLTIGVALGVVGWGGFNWAMEMTNTEAFCLSCHEMKENVYAEYRGTIHDSNASGVRATCPDCHVPKAWTYKIVRKIQASNELWHHVLGTIDTPEKFEEKRLHLARNVWTAMASTNSRECRNCHDFTSMDVTAQRNRARERHLEADKSGATCIDCHKGIAHDLPAGIKEEELHPKGGK